MRVDNSEDCDEEEEKNRRGLRQASNTQRPGPLLLRMVSPSTYTCKFILIACAGVNGVGLV
jgi:hypothetical protein